MSPFQVHQKPEYQLKVYNPLDPFIQNTAALAELWDVNLTPHPEQDSLSANNQDRQQVA